MEAGLNRIGVAWKTKITKEEHLDDTLNDLAATGWRIGEAKITKNDDGTYLVIVPKYDGQEILKKGE